MPVPFLKILASAAVAVRCPASVEAFVPSLAGQQRPSSFSLSSTVSPAPKSIGSSAADDNGEDTKDINAANELDLDAEFDPEHMARDPSAEAAAARNRGKRNDKRKGEEDPSHQQQQHHENDIDLKKYKSIVEFNEELDKLAKRCLDNRPGGGEDVIGLAALAEGMLHRLQHLVRDADSEGDWAAVDHIIRPDVVTVNTVINAWSKAAYSLAEGRGRGTLQTTMDTNMMEINVYTPSDAASRAMAILKEMEMAYLRGETDIAPDTTSYNSVVDALAKSRGGDAATKARALVDRMIHLSNGGEDGKDGVVNGSAELWAKVSPDTVTYNSLLENLAHSPEGLDSALEILATLEEKYDETGDKRIKPNIRTVNQVINSYAKHSANLSTKGYYKTKEEVEEAWNLAEKARTLLDNMKQRYEQTGDNDFKPDAATYTTCCDAYARVGTVEAAKRADELLEEMEQSEHVNPNFRTFTAVITAWAKAPGKRSADRAEEILQKMEDLHARAVKSGKRHNAFNSVQPNARTYTSVINAWARSRDPTKPQRALKILKKMIDLSKGGDESATPTVYSYNAAIDACARCQGTGEQQVQALKIAFAINKALIAADGVEPNGSTFGNLIRCAQYLIPAGDERNSVCKAVFQSAIKAGQVDRGVLRALQAAADRSLFDEVAGVTVDKMGHVQYDAIPFEWRKHANTA